MDGGIEIEPVELARVWRNEDRTAYGTVFQHFHRLSQDAQEVTNKVGNQVGAAIFEAATKYQVENGEFITLTYAQSMAECCRRMSNGTRHNWADLTDLQRIEVATSLGFDPAAISFCEYSTDFDSLAVGNFRSRRVNRHYLRHVKAVTENQKMLGYPVKVAGQFQDLEVEIEDLALRVEIATDAISCLQADGGFPFSIEDGQTFSSNLTSLIYPFADMETCVIPVYQSYTLWMESVQRLNLWMIYKDQSLKPRPVLRQKEQNVVDELVRANGCMTTTDLKEVCRNLYRDGTLDSLEEKKLIRRAKGKGVLLTKLGWRCTSIEPSL